MYVLIYVDRIEPETIVPQLNLYVDEATHVSIKQAAKAAGMSLSKWVSTLVRERTSSEWPPEVLALAGAWKDFPDPEELRKGYGVDLPRETL